MNERPEQVASGAARNGCLATGATVQSANAPNRSEKSMNKLLGGALVVALLLTVGMGQAADQDQPLPTRSLSADYTKWRDHVLPTSTEQSYRTIAWRPSVLHGIIDAQKLDKPIMLVLMNGHPLGCT
jgi:hypothetical protein